jgi:hypothetical protein
MNKSNLVSIVLLSCAMFACKQPSEENIIKAQTEIADMPITAEAVSKKDFTEKRGSALSILDHRISNDTEKSYSIIESGIWEHVFVHNGKKMSAKSEYNGVWIDFKDDGTYSYGTYANVEGKGKYHYDFVNAKLLMINDDKAKNPEEWDIKFGTEIMIMIGTAEYGNNNYQKKLARRKDIADLTPQGTVRSEE